MNYEDLDQYVRLIIALGIVLGLMSLLPFFFKKLGLSTKLGDNTLGKRLKFLESLPLDMRRRLVLIQRDDKQHLVILGPNGETVVETNIKPSRPNAKKTKT